MGRMKAVIIMGETEDVIRAVRRVLNQHRGLAVVGPANALKQMEAVIDEPSAGAGSAEVTTGGDRVGVFAKRVLTRADLAPRHVELFKLLYAAGDAGLSRAELVDAMNISSHGLQGIIGPLGRRIARTPGHAPVAAADGHEASELLLEFRRIDNDWNYRLRPHTRRALEELKMA